MPLIKGGQLAEDPWVTVGAEGDLPEEGPVIVTLARWQADRDALLARGGPLGIRLAPGEAPAEIADDLARFDVVALEFPIFRDGRGYSYARLLRERHEFDGEIRAVGNVLRDQFLFMHRCGFDAFEIEKEADAAAWRRSISEISVWYQPATDSRVPAFRLRHRQPNAAE